MLEIKVSDWYNLFRKHTFEFDSGVTCLIGKNGSGKSTLLKEIKEQLHSQKIKYFYYNNQDSEKGANESFLFYGQIENLVRNISGSEGQNIRYNFEDVIPKIGAYVTNCSKKKQKVAVILLDGLDSGISIDYIDMLKRDLFSLIIEDCNKSGIQPYIILSANNYEFCADYDCLRVSDSKHFKFKDYYDFRKLYINDKTK